MSRVGTWTGVFLCSALNLAMFFLWQTYFRFDVSMSFVVQAVMQYYKHSCNVLTGCHINAQCYNGPIYLLYDSVSRNSTSMAHATARDFETYDVIMPPGFRFEQDEWQSLYTNPNKIHTFFLFVFFFFFFSTHRKYDCQLFTFAIHILAPFINVD